MLRSIYFLPLIFLSTITLFAKQYDPFRIHIEEVNGWRCFKRSCGCDDAYNYYELWDDSNGATKIIMAFNRRSYEKVTDAIEQARDAGKMLEINANRIEKRTVYWRTPTHGRVYSYERPFLDGGCQKCNKEFSVSRTAIDFRIETLPATEVEIKTVLGIERLWIGGHVKKSFRGSQVVRDRVRGLIGEDNAQLRINLSALKLFSPYSSMPASSVVEVVESIN